jgi:hypothetical protein
VQSIGNKAEAKVKCKVKAEAKHEREPKNKAKTKVQSDNMANNPVGDSPRGNPGRINPLTTKPGSWVVLILEKAEAVKLVLFSIDKLTKLNM